MDELLNAELERGRVREVDKNESRMFYQTAMLYEEDQHRHTWIKDSDENFNFSHGKQWTDSEIETNRNRGQYTLTINKLKKGVNNLVGMLLANKPTYHAFPAGEDDTSKSAITNKLLQWVWTNSSGDHLQRDIFKNAAYANTCYFFVKYDSIDKKVRFSKLNYDEVIVDPYSTDMFNRDADWIFVKRNINVETLKEKYDITEVNFNTTPDMMQLDSGGTYSNWLGKITNTYKTQATIYEGYHRFVKDGKYRILLKIMLGYDKCYEMLLPESISDYPIIPAVYEDTGNPYCTALVHDKKDLQRFINKAFGIMILSAQLSSNPKIFIRENDIPDGDVAAFQANYARPGSVNSLRPDAENPLIVAGQPINQAFLILFQSAVRELEQGLVPDEIANSLDTQGNAPDLFQVREAIIDSLKVLISNVEMCMQLVGRVAIQYCKAYIVEEGVLRIIDDKDKIKSFIVNKKVNGIDPDNEESMTKYVEYLQSQNMSDEQITDEISKLKDNKEYADSFSEIMNSTDIDGNDVFIKTGSMLANKEAAEFKVLLALHEQNLVPGEFVVQKAPLSDKKLILSTINSIKQRDDVIKQLQEQLEEANAQANTLKSKIFDADRSVNKAKLEEKSGKQYSDLRAALKNIKIGETFKSQAAVKDFQMELDKVLYELEKQKDVNNNKDFDTMSIQERLNQ